MATSAKDAEKKGSSESRFLGFGKPLRSQNRVKEDVEQDGLQNHPAFGGGLGNQSRNVGVAGCQEGGGSRAGGDLFRFLRTWRRETKLRS